MRIDRTLRQFDLDTLRLFLAVAEEKNIARAADREHIAASAVSKRIHELERGLATPLFRRGSRGVRLTAAGEALVHHARSVFAILDRMRGEMSEHEKGTVGYVRVAANASAIVEFLADDLAAFFAGHPGIRIDLEQDFSLNIVRTVRDGVVDIGVFGTAVPTAGLELLPYRSDRLVVLAPARHPMSKLRRVAFEQTLEFDHIGMQDRIDRLRRDSVLASQARCAVHEGVVVTHGSKPPLRPRGARVRRGSQRHPRVPSDAPAGRRAKMEERRSWELVACGYPRVQANPISSMGLS
jgi:DNA-binding transcriptional LysR family regulator